MSLAIGCSTSWVGGLSPRGFRPPTKCCTRSPAKVMTQTVPSGVEAGSNRGFCASPSLAEKGVALFSRKRSSPLVRTKPDVAFAVRQNAARTLSLRKCGRTFRATASVQRLGDREGNIWFGTNRGWIVFARIRQRPSPLKEGLAQNPAGPNLDAGWNRLGHYFRRRSVQCGWAEASG